MSQTPEQLEKDIRDTRAMYAERLAELARALGAQDAARAMASKAEEFGVELAVQGEVEAKMLRPMLEAQAREIQ